MNRTQSYTARLEPLLQDPGRSEEVAQLLTAESGLPGPRGNLELAWAFAQAVSESPEPAAWLPTLYEWAAIDAEQAPTGDPREFLPFCAVVSFGALYRSHVCALPCSQPCSCPYWPAQSAYLLEAIRRAAEDPRWRMREAAAMALQRLGEESPQELSRILGDWLAGDSLPARRGVLAALAHPPLLEQESLARYALGAADRILKDFAAVAGADRKSEEFRILSKGLSYCLSVFAAALPGEGFALFERWARSPDPDIRRVLVANLKKRRLGAADRERTTLLLQKLAGAA